MTLTNIDQIIYTIDEYFAKEERTGYKYEFNNGKLTLMPGGSNNHSTISVNIMTALKIELRKQKDKYQVFNSDARLVLPNSNRTLYSDGFVAHKPLKEFVRKDIGQGVLNPCLVLEVLSKSTAAYDRGSKFRKYQTIPTLREYVLIEQNSPVVDIFTRDKGGTGWKMKTYEGMDNLAVFPTLGIEIPLTVIYEDIDFGEQEETEDYQSE